MPKWGFSHYNNAKYGFSIIVASSLVSPLAPYIFNILFLLEHIAINTCVVVTAVLEYLDLAMVLCSKLS